MIKHGNISTLFVHEVLCINKYKRLYSNISCVKLKYKVKTYFITLKNLHPHDQINEIISLFYELYYCTKLFIVKNIFIYIRSLNVYTFLHCNAQLLTVKLQLKILSSFF